MVTIPHASGGEPIAAERETAKDRGRSGRAMTTEEVASQALCSICQSFITDGEEIVTCPECDLPFHAECWQENMGCAAYGCPQVNVLKKQPDLRISRPPDASQQGVYGRPVWYCVIDNQFYGPVSALQLATWVRENRITQAAMVWRSGMGDWMPLSSLPELISLVDPCHSARSSDGGFPWELVLLPASAIGFLVSLVARGIPSLLVIIAICVVVAMRLRDAGGSRADPKRIVVVVLAFAVSLAGFLAGVIIGM